MHQVCMFIRELLFSRSLSLSGVYLVVSPTFLSPGNKPYFLRHCTCVGMRETSKRLVCDVGMVFPAARQTREDHNTFSLVCSCCLLLVISSHISGLDFQKLSTITNT